MSFVEFLKNETELINESCKVKITDELKALVTKELHNGYFGAEHRHLIKIKQIDDSKYYALVGHHVDEHQVSLSNIEGLKVGDEIYEIFEFDGIEEHNIRAVDIIPGEDDSGIYTSKTKALEYFKSLKS